MSENDQGQVTKSPPVHSLQIGAIRAAIWANEGTSGTLRFNATFSRRYWSNTKRRDGTQNGRQESYSFGAADCVVLSALARQVADWIQAEEAKRLATRDSSE